MRARSIAMATWAQKSRDFQGPPLPMARVMDLSTSKSLSPSARHMKKKGTLIILCTCVLCILYFFILYSEYTWIFCSSCTYRVGVEMGRTGGRGGGGGVVCVNSNIFLKRNAVWVGGERVCKVTLHTRFPTPFPLPSPVSMRLAPPLPCKEPFLQNNL